jgi:hypothetical protein
MKGFTRSGWLESKMTLPASAAICLMTFPAPWICLIRHHNPAVAQLLPFHSIRGGRLQSSDDFARVRCNLPDHLLCAFDALDKTDAAAAPDRDDIRVALLAGFLQLLLQLRPGFLLCNPSSRYIT